MEPSCLSPEKFLSPALLSQVDNKRYSHLLASVCNDNTAQNLVISFPVSIKDPLEWFDVNRTSFSFNYYWENPSESFAIAAFGSMIELSETGKNRFNAIQHALNSANKNIIHFNTSFDEELDIRFVGGFSFFNEVNNTSWKKYKPALLTLPKYAIIKREGKCSASIALSIDKKMKPDQLHEKILDKLRHFASTKKGSKSTAYFTREKITPSEKPSLETEYQQWINLVNHARERISRSEFQKVVLGRQLSLALPRNFDSVAALRHLRTQYPGCYSFLIKHKNSNTFIGSTPEVLLSVEGNRIQTEALAGSIARGATKTRDQQLEKELLDSVKNHEEHRFVIKDLKKLLSSSVNHLRSANQPQIKKLFNVQHLYTPVEGILNEGASPLSLLGKLHPTPAVGGTPRNQALSYIYNNEPFERGWFASPVGWVSLNRNAQFAVSIRSGLMSEDAALLFAGCGIIRESNPENEWQETNLKFSPMLSALNYD